MAYNLDDVASTKEAFLGRVLRNFANKYGFHVYQVNGQRVFQLTMNCKMDERPPRGTEVFVGHLPRTLCENEFLPLFMAIGKIYQCRLMLDFLGNNRGYAFITYFKIEEAKLAVNLLNGFRIKTGYCIGVHLSMDNCRLFVGGIRQDKTRGEVLEELFPYAEGITDIIMYSDWNNLQMNRGYAFLEFATNRDAAIARRRLGQGNLILWNSPIVVDWAEPLPLVDPEIMKKVTKLYLRNLPINMPTAVLTFHLKQLVWPNRIINCHKTLDYAFVHFLTRIEAENALELLKQGVYFDGAIIEVTWARPQNYSKKHGAIASQNLYCKSLPAHLRREQFIKKQIIKTYKETSSSSSQNSVEEPFDWMHNEATCRIQKWN